MYVYRGERKMDIERRLYEAAIKLIEKNILQAGVAQQQCIQVKEMF